MYFSTDSLHAMGTNWAPLLADLFLYSSEAYFIQQPLKKKENKLSRSFKCTYRNIEDVLSLNNSRFGDFVDSEGRLRTKFFDKRDDFNFPIVNFPFICSNIPAAPAYGVYTLSWYDIPEHMVPVRISLTEGCC
jgi:hypothetical protein